MPEDNHNEAEDQKRAERAHHPGETPVANVGLLSPGTQTDFYTSMVDDSRAGASGAPPLPPVYPMSMLGDPVLYEPGNEPVRISVMTEAQRTFGNRAVQRFLQRRASPFAPVQRDGYDTPLTLQPPSLLQPTDPLKQYGLRGNYRLTLDPRTEAAMHQYVLQQTDIGKVQSAGASFQLPDAAMPSGAPAGGSQPAQAPPAPSSPPTQGAAPNQPGAGPDKPQQAGPGQILSAALASEPFKSGWGSLQNQIISQAKLDWSHLKKGEQVALVATTISIAVGSLAGIALTDDPAARQLVLGQLNGKALPIPGVDWMKFEMNVSGDSLMFGLHADIGALLGPRFGFRPSSITPIGGVPRLSLLPPGIPPAPTQRTVQRRAGAAEHSPVQRHADDEQESVQPFVQRSIAPAKGIAVQRDTPPATTPAASKENFNITNDTFDIEGTTLADAAAVLKGLGDAADTTWHPVYNSNEVDGKVTSVTIDVDINVLMPNWPGASNLNKEAKAEWDRAYKALADHEQGHVDLVKKKLTGVAAKMVGKTKAQADAIFKQAVADLKKESDAYDKTTDHGRKTGTIINEDAGKKPPATSESGTKQSTSNEFESPTNQGTEDGQLQSIQPLQPMRASIQFTIQRDTPTPGSSPTAAKPGAFLVEDSVQSPATGQMKKGDFLAQLRVAVNAAVSEADTVSAAIATPQVALAFATYSSKDAATLETLIRQQIPEAASVTSANAYIPLIAGRVRQSLKEANSKDGQQNKSTLDKVADAGKSLLASAAGLLFKHRDGASPTPTPQDASAVQGQLGAGQPLDSRIRSGLEGVFGSNFSQVRVHTDAQSAGLADNMNARAFTLGHDIAFAPGEYQPGTLLGDALIAHEVAHVAQQGSETAGSGNLPLQKGAGETTELEEEADTAAVGAIASLWGGARGRMSALVQNAMPRLKSGLRLQRCGRSDSLKRLAGDEAQAAISKWKLHLMPYPATPQALTGMEIRYLVDPFETEGEFPHAERWSIQAPGGDKPSVPWQVSERDKSGQSVKLEKAGAYAITADIQVSPQEIVPVTFTQQVGDPAGALDQDLKGLPPANAQQIQDMLKKKEADITHGATKDQKVGDSYITSDGDNPAKMQALKPDPNSGGLALRTFGYTVKPKQGATHYRWYVAPHEPGKHFPNFHGYKMSQINGQQAYDLNSDSTSARWIIEDPDVYTIVCEQFDDQKTKVGEARYAQVVLTADEEKRLDQLKKAEQQMTKDLGQIKAGWEIGLKAIHYDTTSGKETVLTMFIGLASGSQKGVRLVDSTPGIPWQTVYEGNSATEVLDSFDGSNKYPKGYIRIQIPPNTLGIQYQSRTIQTTAESTLGAASGGFGWASLGLTALAIGLTLTGVGAIAVPYLFVAAAATGAASSAFSIADHIKDAKRSDLQIAIDIANIAASLVGMAALRKTMSTGLSLVQLGAEGKFYIWAQSAADLTSGVLIAADGVTEIDKIMSSNMTPEDKKKAIMGILTNVAMVGGMLAYGAKDLNVQAARLEAKLGAQAMKGLSSEALENLAKLNEHTLTILNGATRDELEQIGRLAKENPERVNQLAKEYGTAMLDEVRSKPPGNLEELATNLKRQGCFVAGTQVITPDGQRPIESLVVGDTVVAYQSQGEMVIANITRTFVHTVPTLLDIRVAGTVITCSPEHPFWVPGTGWLEAGALKPSMPLLTKAGPEIYIDSISRRNGSFTVYNLHVDEINTYYVSAMEILVHNKAAPRVTTKEELTQYKTETEGKVTALEQNVADAEKNRLAPDPKDGNAIADYKKKRLKQHKDDLFKVKRDMAETAKLADNSDTWGKATDKYDEIGKQADALSGKVAERLPGEGISATTAKGTKPEWGNPKSQVAYGHSTLDHGSKRPAQELRDRAENTNNSPEQGQFYDDMTIVEAERLAPLTPGAHDVPFGRPIGRVYVRGGTIVPDVQSVRVVRSADLTVTTSFPIR